MMYAAIDENEDKEGHWKNKVMASRENDPVLSWITAASTLSIGLIPENSNDSTDITTIFSLERDGFSLNRWGGFPNWLRSDSRCWLDGGQH